MVVAAETTDPTRRIALHILLAGPASPSRLAAVRRRLQELGWACASPRTGAARTVVTHGPAATLPRVREVLRARFGPVAVSALA